MSDQPWHYLIARIRPHQPIGAPEPADVGRALRDVLGPLDLDEIYLFAEPRSGPLTQVWDRPVVPGTDPTVDPVAVSLHLVVDQLQVDAGWERTA